MRYNEILLEASKDVLINKNKDRVWKRLEVLRGPNKSTFNNETPESFIYYHSIQIKPHLLMDNGYVIYLRAAI